MIRTFPLGRLLRDAPLRLKAFAASAVLLIFLITLGGHAYLTAEQSAADLVALSKTNLPKREAIAELDDEVMAAHVRVFRFVTWSSNGVNSRLLESISTEIRSDLAAIRGRLESLGAPGDLSAEERAVVNDLFAKWEKYVGAVKDTLDVGRTDAPMAKMMLGATDDDFQKIAADLQRLSGLVHAQTKAIMETLVVTAERNKAILAIGGLAGMLLSVMIALLVGRSIVEPMRSITKAMKEVSAGNVDFEIGHVDRNDELGEMVKAIAAFRKNLQTQNLRLDAAMNNMSQGLCMFDPECRVTVSNDRFARMYGLSPEQMKPGTALAEIVQRRIANGIYAGADPEQYLREQLAPVIKASTVIHELSDGRAIEVSCQPTPDGGWVTTHEDICDRRQAEKQIAYMAHHDAVTDLPNRILFRERAEQALAGISRGEKVAVLCIDLDRFKNVNDTLGHAIGDVVLRSVAGRLSRCTRQNDTIARLGGDEFAVVQVEGELPQAATTLAQRIIDTLSAPYDIAGQEIVIGASIGLAIAPTDGTAADQLLKNADMALYRAKADGRGVYRFFEPEMDAQMQARRVLEIDLRRALTEHEFEIFYQPEINLRSNRIVSFEALLRWHHPERGLVLPAEFIPLAEEIGLIVPLGEWVLKQACNDATAWGADIKVAVNLSPAQFKSRTLVEAVIAALAISKLSPSRLELEITEGVLLTQMDATLVILHQLRALGASIAMDDFGTGYSPLSYLRSFPFDRIKIDSSFVRDMSENQSSMAVVRAVIGLGISLGIATTAEGVETQEQLDRIGAEGCSDVQGFFFSKAKCAAEAAAMARSNRQAVEAA
jgi:diguanylate cyclase (GGDEF)-like protein